MTPTQAVELVALVANACPSMRIEPGTPDVWYRLLADLDHTDAVTAVERLARTQPYLAASDIRATVRAIRAERIERGYATLTPPDPDNPTAYRQELHTQIARLAAGLDIDCALAAPPTGTPCPPGLRDPDAPTRVTAMTVACPWCHTNPGEPCRIPGTRQLLAHTGVHPARIHAAQETP